MLWYYIIRLALRSILKNRMRSLLTTLGIVIGVASVIALVSIGRGTQAKIEGQIATLGTNLITIRPGRATSFGVSKGASSLNTLTLEDIARIEEDAPSVQYVSPVISVSAQVISESKNWSTSIQGVSESFLEIRDWALERGSFFTRNDVKARKKVAVLGKTVATELFGDADPVGARIRIGTIPFTVIGVLEAKGEGMGGRDQDDIVMAPSTTVLYRMSDGKSVGTIMASAVSAQATDQAEKEMTSILRSQHRIPEGQEDDFHVHNQTEITETAQSVTNTIITLLSAIAAVSLLVGGIGIMNIMLVSVTERTREIGIRLAVGARESDVLAQFLVESFILSLSGGVIGTAVGVAIGYILARWMGQSIVVDPVWVLTACIFSGAVGIFFGFYPARKASRLDPIEALRYE
jgi:putative ABC transport system permease protein